ncbi:TatD family hydrolase [Schaalia sp. 19OD2882]|uniref:TatD family hydrolase n=1 Tax=Schaalia sp. 19OD2882 TaxID=2794089 RepID=UPI001C1EC45A|nr:TatD family hydrolase [Schaalia sp. 19OD2882]QWW20046.1 TatD family hydrolase [Schaalia sp. 19OD2882]
MSKRKTRTWPEAPEPLAGTVIDNHTHLPVHEMQIPRADGVRLPLEDQLERARAAGITRIVSCACEVPDFDPMIALAAEHPQVRVALAIHPNEAALHAGHADPSPDGLTPIPQAHHTMSLDEAINEVASRLHHPAVVAVGETGLDHHRTAGPGRHAQKASFRAHLALAREADLPLQIHDRDAHAETLAILRTDAHPDQPIVFHCFSGGAEMAGELAANGWYASFAGPITYPGNGELREALKAMPRDLVLVETDAPYLTPAPHRGSPNASYVMAHTVRAIAQLWGIDEGAACAQLSANTDAVYGMW